MKIFLGIIREAYILFNEMSPYLLFGFIFAGVLHVFIDTKSISRHLGHNSFLAVIKASLFGIPLPLCSCSVIPAAMSLRKEGAARGAVLSFLISTPTTGVDSIFATYALLGGFFTVYRIIASFVTGVLSGIVANALIKETDAPSEKNNTPCKLCGTEEIHSHGLVSKVKGVFSYAFGDLLKDSGKALLAGILIGGIITYFVPETFIITYLGSGLKAMFVMLIVGIPMYVCATASIPIAAALMMKGLDPGAAFVFLVAGPATNIVTMSVVAKNMGIKTLVVYLGSIVLGSILLGIVLDKIYFYFDKGELFKLMVNHRILIPVEARMITSIVLFVLIAYNLFNHTKRVL
ncbi:MAG: SO_0444 family Cu/Zn efflux transporter [Candidatus Omnitrophota bacterium]|nr:SO_0444 family Cu/Zn efflux transporter [Candidatus Omnitrophota bacterium]MBU1894961.1 SO_0444 family Cu/Zn efflux transporter [Candidatus Omnitrophota bacterium]